jgi:hypothetical protein
LRCWIPATGLTLAALALLAAPADALEPRDSLGPGEREEADRPLLLRFDPFDTGTDVKPLWLGLPPVAFLVSDKPSGTWVLSPEPLGPPQIFELAVILPSLLDPNPMGPPQSLREEHPVVAAQPRSSPPGFPESTTGPEHTGSTTILRRRY